MARLARLLPSCLVVLVGFSGCVEFLVSEDAGEQVTIPGLRHGDEWSIADVANGVALPGSGVTVSVAPSSGKLLDRYGRSVEAVALTRVKGDSESASWIETAGGNWISHRYAGHGGSSSRCMAQPVPGVVVSRTSQAQAAFELYPRTAVPASFGMPWGKTFVPGQTLVERAVFEDDFFSYSSTFEYRVLGNALIRPLVTGGLALETVVVERFMLNERLSDSHGDTWRSREQWFLNAAYPVPVRIQVVDKGEVRVTGELEVFRRGGATVALGSSVVPSSFAPTNPDGHFGVSKNRPPLGFDRLEFGFEEAIAVAMRDVKNPTALVWLVQHPNAVVVEASYTRDPARGVYDWQMQLYDNGERVWLTAERRGVGGQGIDSVSASGPHPAIKRFKSPQGDFADIASSLEVAKAFEPRLREWRTFQWRAIDYDLQDSYDPRWSYGFAYAVKSRDPGPAPMTETEVTQFVHGPTIDGKTGGRSSFGSHFAFCRASVVPGL